MITRSLINTISCSYNCICHGNKHIRFLNFVSFHIKALNLFRRGSKMVQMISWVSKEGFVRLPVTVTYLYCWYIICRRIEYYNMFYGHRYIIYFIHYDIDFFKCHFWIQYFQTRKYALLLNLYLTYFIYLIYE
jgi:hypothetical protein